MIIKRIKYLKRFGIFQDFAWNNNTSDFKTRNIIYGWNYSGKTTLSRFFDSLSSSTALTSKLPIFKIEIEQNGTTKTIENTTIDIPVFVFNNDYIDRNLHFHTIENTKIKGLLFDIGEVSFEKRKELNEAKEKAKVITDWLKTNIDAIQAFSSFEKIFTNAAKNIKNEVFESAIEFTRRHFMKEMSVLSPNNLSQYIIESPSELATVKSNALQKNPMEPVSYNFCSFDLDKLINSVNNCITFSPSLAKEEKLLDSYQVLNSTCRELTVFYNENNSITTCAFCGNPITKNRIDELNAYYTNEASKLRTEIEELIKQIDSLDADIRTNRTSFLSSNDFIESCREELDYCKSKYFILLDEICDILSILKKSLLTKLQSSLFNKMQSLVIDVKLLTDYNIICSSITSIIERHNNTVSNFLSVKNNAITKLKLHYIAKTLRESNYFRIKNAKERQEKERGNKEREFREIQEKISLIQSELTSIIKGQERLNYYIQLMLNRKDLTIRVTNDNYFELVRGEEIAQNLSEGEKSVIAFAYFLVFLENINEQNGLSNALIFIDDPISSLDNNHIAQVASLINKFFFYIDESGKTCENFAQLFITTHNFEFFTFIRDANNMKRKRNCPLFLLKRISENNVVLEDLPKAFSNYDSEYLYLFSEIYNYYVNNCPEEQSYIMPNIIRRFLEIYTRIKLPGNHDEIDNRIRILTEGCPNELKFLHYFSHCTTLERAVKHSELILKIPEITSDVISFLQIDKDHYNSLVAGIS